MSQLTLVMNLEIYSPPHLNSYHQKIHVKFDLKCLPSASTRESSLTLSPCITSSVLILFIEPNPNLSGQEFFQRRKLINQFHINVPFLYPWGLLMFSGGIEMEHWREMG